MRANEEWGSRLTMKSEQYPVRQEGNAKDVDALIGKTLGQYRVVERIGAGGMATVFKAYQATLDRYVAMKVLPTYHARDPVFMQRFVQEARSVAKLAHPNIVPTHDFGSFEGITCIVMEYVEGGTLKDRLKQPLTISETVDYIIQAAEGLACAHRNGIIHRDVKPANMLLRKDGYLLLSDFGIAKILEGTPNLTRTGAGIGTPQYMSPEQGSGRAVDGRSDIYSLGIVLFHCLSGRVPFNAENPLSITVKHMHEPLPVEMLRAMQVPPALEQIVVKMTAKSATDRYQATEEVIEALTLVVSTSHLSAQLRWRHGLSMPLSLPLSEQVEQPGAQSPSAFGHTQVSLPQQANQQLVTLGCFRCGATNPSTRLFCTSCGYDLSDKGAASDHYRAPSGRPVLARLTFRNGPIAGRSYLFHQDVTTIGRTNGNDLIISGRTVSRRHARLWFDNGRWYLDDLQSANGTLVNNTRLHQNIALNDGDIIHFGDEVVVFNTIY